MGFTALTEKIKLLFEKGRDSFRNLWSKIFHPVKEQESETQNQNSESPRSPDRDRSVPVWGKLFAALAGKITLFREWFIRTFGPGQTQQGNHASGTPQEAMKKRVKLLGLGGLTALFLILIITALIVNSGKPNKSPVSASASSIPSDELFIPAEPDFLPKILLQREPRSFWSLEDISPYWKSPADQGVPAESNGRGSPQELWRGEIKSAVDKLMEGVP